MNEQLMDYLYGELSAQERAAFEQELQNNPQLQQELKDFQSTRSMLHQVEEIQPKATVVELKPKPVISTRAVKWLSAAAAIALLLLVGKPRMEVGSDGFMIAFGYTNPVNPSPAVLPVAEQQSMIHNAVAESNQEIYKLLDSIQNQLGARINTKEQMLLEAIERELSSYENQHQRQVARVVSNQYEENIPRLVSMTQDMQLEQRRELKGMMNRLWKDVQRQREADLQAIERAFLELQQQQSLGEVSTSDD
ncbi:MAG: hypothetical protein AAFO82_00235 [Bacteroidota bacterium]